MGFLRSEAPFQRLLEPLLICFTFIFLLPMTSNSKPTIEYVVSMPQPSTHYFHVEMTLSNLPSPHDSLDFVLPVWRPGRYMVLDLAGGVQEFSARDEKKHPIAWRKVDKTTWRVANTGSTLTVQYKVYANEFNLRTRGLNDEHGFIDGSSVFMYVETYRRVPLTLRVHPFGTWHVTTGLEHVAGDPLLFTAPDYDYFIDCPLEIGNQRDHTFDIDGTPHVLSIFGEGNYDVDTLIRDITTIVKNQRDMFGGFPYKRYVFILHVTPTSGGGTEHINSTAMGARPFVFKNPESYRGFLGLVSHEFFHTWNVKQFRPEGIHPYDYTGENYTDGLWVAEGTTSYYDNLVLLRTGLMSAAKYREVLATAIGNDRQRPGNSVQSLAEGSFDAWIKFWKGNQQSYNSEIDYYDKGASVSMLLDLEIRHRSGNKASLDDVMKEMYKRFPLSGNGYSVKDVQRISEEYAGGSLEEFFQGYVYGTRAMDWEKIFSYAGLDVEPKDTVQKPWTGFVTVDAGERTRVTRVIAGSPAAAAGVDINDEIVAVNGFRARTADINDRAADTGIGGTLRLTLFRNDRLREIELKVGSAPVSSYFVLQMKDPTPEQKAIYEDWLKTPWEK